MKTFSQFLSIAMLTGFVSCNESADNQPVDRSKPSANLISHSAVVDQKAASPTLNFEIEFTDDQALKEYKVDIHDSFDGHSHGRVEATKKFTFVRVYPMSGKSHKASVSLPIPKDAPTGPYHLFVKYIDASGNEGDELETDFEIQNESTQPKIVVEAVSDAKRGSILTISGTVSDPDGEVEELILVVTNKETGTEIFETDKHIHSKSENFEFQFLIPTNAPSGTYAVRLAAVDDDGNHTVVEKEFKL